MLLPSGFSSSHLEWQCWWKWVGIVIFKPSIVMCRSQGAGCCLFCRELGLLASSCGSQSCDPALKPEFNVIDARVNNIKNECTVWLFFMSFTPNSLLAEPNFPAKIVPFPRHRATQVTGLRRLRPAKYRPWIPCQGQSTSHVAASFTCGSNWPPRMAAPRQRFWSLKCILPLDTDEDFQALCRIKGYFPLICRLDLKIRQQSEAMCS